MMQRLVERAGEIAVDRMESDPDWPLISRLARRLYQIGQLDHMDALDLLPELARQAAA
jgi:hypothetical protein